MDRRQRIAAIGASAETPVPSGAEVVDYTGTLRDPDEILAIRCLRLSAGGVGVDRPDQSTSHDPWGTR